MRFLGNISQIFSSAQTENFCLVIHLYEVNDFLEACGYKLSTYSFTIILSIYHSVIQNYPFLTHRSKNQYLF